MNTRALLTWGSLLIVLIGSVIPLITLRAFPGHVDAWLTFLVFLAPAYLLVALIVLSRHISPYGLAKAAVSFLAFLTLGFLLGRVFLWFLVIFAIAAGLLVWVSFKFQSGPHAVK